MSRTYLQRHGRLLIEGGHDATDRAVLWPGGVSVDGRGVPSGRRPGAQPNKKVRTFRTVTRDLEALRDWLRAGVPHVGMESKGFSIGARSTPCSRGISS